MSHAPPPFNFEQERIMLGLTTLGTVHTAISLVAVGAGITGLVRDKRINFENGAGKTYLIMTILTCLTGFGIFEHGGFGKPHALGIMTLLVLGVAWITRSRVALQAVLLSVTFFFHMIPAMTETLTRLPLGSPILRDAEAPELKGITGVLLLLLVVGATLQYRKLSQSLNRSNKAAAF